MPMADFARPYVDLPGVATGDPAHHAHTLSRGPAAARRREADQSSRTGSTLEAGRIRDRGLALTGEDGGRRPTGEQAKARARTR